MSERSNHRYLFDEFSLDPIHRSFRKNGEELHLPAKEFDTLLYFVENHGRILPKEEMISAIWEDTFVEEGNLAQYVSRLRKILDSNGQNYIQTLPKKGYRFDANVNVVGGVADTSRSYAVWLGAGVCLLLFVAAAAWWVVSDRKVKPDSSEKKGKVSPVALTDGKQDDTAIAWTSDNHIRYLHHVSRDRVESWVMNPDGTDKHREEAPIKGFLNGTWSPDGKKVHFTKEGDSKTTYLADADGSNEIALPLLAGNSDWSPDSSSIVYETKVAEDNTEIFLYTLATRQNVDLTRNAIFDADPSFTPDGKHILFVSTLDGNADVYMMDTSGKIERKLTNDPAFDKFPSVSPDGTQMIFFSNREEGEVYMYIRNMNDDSPPIRVTDIPAMEGSYSKCWSADGTEIVFTSFVNGKDQIFRTAVEPYSALEVIADENADLQFPRVSPDGTKLLYQARTADQSIELRISDLDGRSARTIFRTEPGLPKTFVLIAVWSPDGEKVAFANKANDNPRIFLMNADGSGLRPLTDGLLPASAPVFSKDGKEIFFVQDLYGKPKIFRMNVDGTDVLPLDNKEGYEQSPSVSRDGKIVFSADRLDGRRMGLDLYAIDQNAPENEHLLISLPMHEDLSTFSADGRRIAFAANGDGNSEIYFANSDGTGLVRLTRNKANDSAPTFLPDGRGIIFSSDRAGKYALYRIDLPF